MTPEGIVKKNVKKILDRWKPHVWYFMPVSSGYGAHGIPDFICCVHGQFFSIECKGTVNATPTDLQAAQMVGIHDAQGYAITVGKDREDVVETYINMIISKWATLDVTNSTGNTGPVGATGYGLQTKKKR